VTAQPARSSGEFLVDERLEEAPVEQVAHALSAHVVHTHTEHTAWLDTQDWRLFRAGLLLEERRTRRDAWLQLSDVNGERLSSVGVGEGPVTLATLPEGATKHRLARAVGRRALVPRAAAEGPASLLAVLDDRGKTVARVAVRGPLTVDAGESVGVRVRVEPLRGYAKDARRVERRLAATSGLEAADRSLFDAVARARGLVPGRYRSKPDLTLRRELPAGQAFSGTLGQLLEIVRDNLDGTLGELDTEFLHDLRVAVRRSRSVLKVARTVIDEPVRGHYARQLKWLADATSASRDLDVYLLTFDAMVPRGDAEAVEPFRRLLQSRHRRAHAALNRSLRARRCTTLLTGWERDLVRREHSGPAAGSPVGEVAEALLRKAWSRVLKRGDAIGPDSPPQALHDLRKRCKELRYLLEFFASLYDPKVHRGLVGELKRLQDNLGAFQDAESQRDLVLDCAEELRTGGAPAETLLTMGRMEQHMRQRQQAAHDDFAACWERFGDRRNKKRFTAMVSSP
jgi:CHAD domain-containing protein